MRNVHYIISQKEKSPNLLRLVDKKIATSGWGRYPLVAASVQHARYLSDLCRAGAARILPQGNCRSYGDACLYERVVSTLPLKHLLDFDSQRGILRAQAGITFADIIRFALPRGFFPPVTPGTKFPTLGGCIAADVHGKNHHAEGSIAAFVESLDMVLADGSPVRCSRSQCADLFWATLGGMGLTGFIYAATLRLKKVSSAYIRQRAIKTASWAETCRVCTETQHQYTYSVAWIDGLQTGRQLGRGRVLLGEHASARELKGKPPFPLHGDGRWAVPFSLPGGVLNSTSLKAFNALYYHCQVRRSTEALVHYDPYFYPLDAVRGWNRLYGRRGFLQYQIAVPYADGAAVIAELLGRIAHQGVASPLAVLKTFGPASEGLLSFPLAGYTLALDIPLRDWGTIPFLRTLNKTVVEAKGRVYLAKDAILEREDFAAMYPQLKKFKAVKRKYDPEHCFRSCLSDRLGIT